MTLARQLKLLKLPEAPQTPGLRPLVPSDYPQVTTPLLSRTLPKKLTLTPNLRTCAGDHDAQQLPLKVQDHPGV